MNVRTKLTSDIEGLAHQVDPLSRRGFFLTASAAAAAGYTLAAGPVSAQAIHTDTTGITVGDAKVKVADGEMPVYYAKPANVANATQTVAVTLTVTPTATLGVSTSSLTFAQNTTGQPPAPQTVSVTGTGAAITFQATATVNQGGGQNWLSVSPQNATTPSTLNVSVNGAGLLVGTYTGSIKARRGTEKRFSPMPMAACAAAPIAVAKSASAMPATLNMSITARPRSIHPAMLLFPRSGGCQRHRRRRWPHTDLKLR